MVLWHVIFWGILAVTLIIAEFATVQFISVWFAAGSLGAFILSLFGVEFYWQVIIFVIISIVLLLLTRTLATKFFSKDHVKTNADSLISKECVVIEDVDATKENGRVHVDGLDWAARSANKDTIFKKGDTCIIKEIQGVTLIVDSKQ